MDFICLEAGCYPSILHPSSPRMLPQPLEMEVTLSWYIHISSCRPLWLRERKCLGTKSLSVSGEVSQPSSPVPSHLPSSFHVQCFLPLASPPFWLSYPAAFQQSGPRSSLTPPRTPCRPSVPLGVLPFLGYHGQTFCSSVSAIHRYYPWIPHWLVKCAILTFKLECRLPEGRRDASFTLFLTVVYVR